MLKKNTISDFQYLKTTFLILDERMNNDAHKEILSENELNDLAKQGMGFRNIRDSEVELIDSRLPIQFRVSDRQTDCAKRC